MVIIMAEEEVGAILVLHSIDCFSILANIFGRFLPKVATVSSMMQPV